MASWGRENWGNGHQLLCAARKGGYLELEVPVPATGDLQLAVRFTRGPDYGVVQVSIDGKPIGRPFDSFNPGIVPSVQVDLGQVDLLHGYHRLRFTAVGKNRQSTGFLMGIDCLELRPLK